MTEPIANFIQKMIRYFDALPPSYPDRDVALAVVRRWEQVIDGGPEAREEISELYSNLRAVSGETGSPAIQELLWRMGGWLENEHG